MKLKPLQNLPDLNFKQVPTIGTSAKNRISYYFWVLLFLPTLIVFSSTSAFKWFVVVLLASITGWYYPQGFPIEKQSFNIKKVSTIQMYTSAAFVFMQILWEGFDILRILIQFVGIYVCYSIKNMDAPNEAEIEADNVSFAEKGTENEIIENIYTFDRWVNFLTLFSIGAISGIRDCQYEPLVIFSILVVEIFTRRFEATVKYCGIFKLMSAVYVLVVIIPKCMAANGGFWTQMALLACALKWSLTFSFCKSLIRLRKPLTVHDFATVRDPKKFSETLKKYPNATLLLDRFWTLLIPIPLVISLWSIALVKNEVIDPPIIGIISMLAATLIIVQVHWILARVAVVKILQFMITCLLLTILNFEAPSSGRRIITLTHLALFVVIYVADGIYSHIYEMMRSGVHFKARNSFYSSGSFRLYAESMQRIWTATSPFVSAFIISVLTMKTIHSDVRIILLALSALAGIFSRSNFQITWALIEIYVIIEQIYLLFLSQPQFPAELNPKITSTVFVNVLILIIAEIQRLRRMPSIFSNEGANSRIRDANSEESEISAREEEDEEEEPDYDNSLIWRGITTIGQITNVTSLLFLMAVILFYPQFVDVTIQTCIYSFWAFLFTFLFYRSDVTSRLRFIFILILAVISCAFFIFDLHELHSGDYDKVVTLINGGKPVNNRLFLHGLVFWFSCGALLVMNLDPDGNQKSETSAGNEDENPEETPVKSLESSPKMTGSKLVDEAGSFVERVFVVYWTRSCAMLAFLAASLNPSILGVGHLIIGCFLAWKNTLSPELYVPMIIWILCATFLPAAISKFSNYEDINLLLVGEIKSYKSTVCLTLWAMALFLQPVFIKSLDKLATEKDRKSGLVSFQILPQNDNSNLSQNNYESFENSTRYYVSNWFVEFHNEIMVAVLVIVAVSRMNFYGIFSSILAILHVLIPMLGKELTLKALATISFSIQMFCFILEYCLSLMYSNFFNENSELNMDRTPTFLYGFLNTIAGSETLQTFFGLGAKNASIILRSIWVGMNIVLTVRWYLTSSYYEREKPATRFDSHWCRLCNQVNFKSMHAYSKVKHNIHLYLGWLSHAFLFMTAISAHDQPTVPSVLLLILSLVFFFYGESSILMPQLRNQVYVVLGIILSWVFFNSLVSTFALFGITEVSATFKTIFNYLGMTNIFQYIEMNSTATGVFGTSRSRGILGITVFLILLQIRLYRSKAWPFVLARLYHSYATSAKRARLFHHNLQAAINFQQKNLEKAKEYISKQVGAMKTLDISDWRKLCYQPPKNLDDRDTEEEKHMPEYGIDTEEFPSSEGETDSGKMNVAEIRQRLRSTSGDALQQHEEEDHLDSAVASGLEETTLNLNERVHSMDSLVPSDEAAKKEIKEAESNFYWYTWLSMLRLIAKFLLSSAQDYRRLLSRPSKKTSMRILFHHQNAMYRAQFFMQLIFDLINANFDYVVDYLVIEAQLFHSSGFSLGFVLAVLLLSRIQRPYTNKTVHGRMILFCAAWIIFNFCKVVLWKSIEDNLKAQGNNLTDLVSNLVSQQQFIQKSGQGFFHRFFGFHIYGKIQDVTLRPTLILLALSYKRSLMRQLGLWDYGKEIQMARNYYQSEEDLDEIGEINVPETQSDNDNNEDSRSIFSTETSDDDSLFDTDSIMTDNSNITILTSWKELLWPTVTMPWRDYYVPMFISDFICLILVVYYWGEFSLGHRNSTNSFLSEMINQNMVPASLVNIVFLSTFALVIDRALYVSKNYLGKIILQCLTLIGYHIYMFFYLTQFYQNPNLSLMGGVKLWYLCKWIYWISSALQLKYNYPPLRTESFLGTEYGIVSANLHVIYRNIPFVDELKTIIDWSMTPSALGMWPWLKIADIYERLYAVQCARAFQRTYYGRHQFGMPFNQFSKIMQGVIFITLAVFVLWSPFLILSRSWMMTPNTVESFKLEIGLENNGPPFMTFFQDNFPSIASSKEFEKFRFVEGVNPLDFDESFFTKVVLPIGSQVPWQVSEKARIDALKYLENRKSNVNANLIVKWTITRQRSQTHPVIQGSNVVKLNLHAREALKLFLDNSHNLHMVTVPINNLIPTLLKAPINENSRSLDTAGIDKKYRLVRICPRRLSQNNNPTSELSSATSVNTEASLPHAVDSSTQTDDMSSMVSLPDSLISAPDRTVSARDSIDSDAKREKAQGFWRKIQKLFKNKKFTEKALGMDKIHGECQYFLLSSDGGLQAQTFIYSNKMPYYNFSSMNFTGLYFTIVLTASQLLKMMHADMTTRIQYDELPNPLPLLIMCQQILMMRELGDFENEEAIYWQLIEILRNPQILIEMTKL